ncbi:hypothetical protein HaLaN_20139 [Haematococcus lacustris]|uniref:Uncharacterized protein n=1 Tax=Haematococcus lacustris TaxID=44745 RepID=A0A699ZJ68_HAELA|nr:hypothetical protein HaLaN_20139 [Haematococcus lacustris]
MSLAEATHVILERRERMLERHVLPDVVADVKYKECLARAVADTSVVDEQWRLELRLAMANQSPLRSLVLGLMAFIIEIED